MSTGSLDVDQFGEPADFALDGVDLVFPLSAYNFDTAKTRVGLAFYEVPPEE